MKNKSKLKGTRYNKGKLRWRNFPLFLMRPLAEVGSIAEKHPGNPKGKYETYNFLQGLSVSDCLDSAMRHLDKGMDPKFSDYDEETGLHHFVHGAWNLLVAFYYIKNYPEFDDRLKTKRKNK